MQVGQGVLNLHEEGLVRRQDDRDRLLDAQITAKAKTLKERQRGEAHVSFNVACV